MSRTMTSIIAGVACASVFVTVPSTQQRGSDLSGHWLLAAATTTLGRSAEQGGVPQPPSEVPTKATTVSGAAFNCGRDCTIVQTNQTLTVEAALLGSDVSRASPVTFRLDEQVHLVTDSFNPQGDSQVERWQARDRDRAKIQPGSVRRIGPACGGHERNDRARSQGDG